MDQPDWKDNLDNFIEDLKVIEKSKVEALNNFNEFCEFIAEPAFESLSKELRKYKIKSKIRMHKGKSTAFIVNFTRSGIDNFHYIISLPKNSLELKLKLQIRGRRSKKNLMEDREGIFMEQVAPAEILKLKKEEIIQDVIKHYRNFNYEAFTKPE